ncbi:transporter [Mycolicibacterium canariasense]|uniref:Transporter n=1 Tax=Mycolicibacterium canariasense TaxID=228230 RepID=A0A100WK70_MYCCR|nr:MFS transporter [Mycolicibacterium canariasense]MCV7207591.1 MFS transporter [Mycolicibacterium canariasense]ORV08819.1 MFS transporter [Mycolicibacterium canariasense]GAS99701.1 transporter [Mycolicibacterium canariasense]
MILRHPVFRRLYTAQVTALAGTGLLTVALGLLAFDLAGGAAGAVLSTALAIKMVAYVFAAPVMSGLTAGLPRKAVLVGADIVRAVVALALPWVDQVWQIYLLVFVLQAASATFTPTFQAVIADVLPDERQYTRALALSRLAYDLEALLSPLLAAALLTVVSYHGLFAGTGAGFLVSLVLVLGTAIPRHPATGASAPLLSRISVGTRIMLRSRELRSLLAMNVVAASATGLVVVNTVVYVRGLLGGGNADVALLLACYGAGSMTLALLIPGVLGRVADRTVMLGGAALAAAGLLATALVLATGSVGRPVLTALWIVLGAATSMITTPAGRLLRRNAGEHRTAVFTAQFSLSHAGFLITYPVAGWIGAAVDQAAAAGILAILATFAAIVAVRMAGMARRAGTADEQGSTPARAEALAGP